MANLWTRLKSYIPVSSRSFHAFEGHVNASLVQLADSVVQLANCVDDRTDQISRSLSGLKGEHDYEQKRDMMLYWHLLQRASGDSSRNLEDVKVDFFHSLPRPQGVFGLFQNNLAKLLGEFDALCRACDISYFAGSGTLLGAHLYNDLIPWDDDIDVFVFRSDLSRLRDIVESDSRFRITERWDRCCACKQIRFRLSDEDNPAFVDLFPLDVSSSADSIALWKECLGKREQFARDFFELSSSSDFKAASWPYIDSSTSHWEKIESLYDSCLNNYSSPVNDALSLSDPKTILRGIDNISEARSSGPWPYSDWAPAEEMEFRDFKLYVPREWRRYLERHYGDFYIIPKDMDSHGHVSRELFEEESTNEALRRYVSGGL